MKPSQGKIAWRSPSNIALIKYWGKQQGQIPMNPSLSFSLKNSYTETILEFEQKRSIKANLELYFEGKLNTDFKKKVETKLKVFPDSFRFLEDYDLIIRTHNSFPHSAGIASSASSMSALALCLLSMKEILFGSVENFFEEASHLSRIASGSASRSVFGSYVIWGENSKINRASNLHAIPLSSSIHPVFQNLQDAILIVDDEKKSVSSSAGHQLMNNHPFRKERIILANSNFNQLISVLADGDWDHFTRIIENEALTLHSLMMNSNPWFILLKPNTLLILEKIKNFRQKTGVKIAFTIDAGPNVHVLFPEEEKAKVEGFFEEELLHLCKGNQIIKDRIGLGPIRIE